MRLLVMFFSFKFESWDFFQKKSRDDFLLTFVDWLFPTVYWLCFLHLQCLFKLLFVMLNVTERVGIHVLVPIADFWGHFSFPFSNRTPDHPKGPQFWYFCETSFLGWPTLSFFKKKIRSCLGQVKECIWQNLTPICSLWLVNFAGSP